MIRMSVHKAMAGNHPCHLARLGAESGFMAYMNPAPRFQDRRASGAIVCLLGRHTTGRRAMPCARPGAELPSR